jgi:hypothetical protein
MGWNQNGQLGDGFTDAASPYGTATPEQIVPRPQPILSQALVANSDLQFTANCAFGGNFYLLAGTNLTQPLNLYTRAWTNVITSRYTNTFSATLTNAVNSGDRQFYILQSQ